MSRHPRLEQRPNAPRFAGPFERCVQSEAGSGLVLLAAAAVALLWANSPWAQIFAALWITPVGRAVLAPGWVQPLRFWVNDGLMTIFFLVVTLEIRCQISDGALRAPRAALLPVIAALGGVLMPAGLYLALNTAAPLRLGWAIPTATDIAFAVGVLALLGRRVPPAMRAVLLTLAIVDDLVAIFLIASLYSHGIQLAGLGLAACGLGAVMGLQKLGVQHATGYAIPGIAVWIGLLRAGVPPTMAGVLLGLLTPTAAGWRRDEASPDFSARSVPAARVRAALHPWVAFGILPLFALANAGIPLHGSSSLPQFHWVALGIVLGLVVGKPLGIVLASAVAVRLGWCVLPASLRWRHVIVLGCLGGIGFTLSIFIAALAFAEAQLLVAAKSAVLLASATAAVVSLILGRLLLPLEST